MFQLDIESIKNRTYFLKCQNVVYRFVASDFFTLGYTGADEYDFCVRVFFFGDPCGIIHG